VRRRHNDSQLENSLIDSQRAECCGAESTVRHFTPLCFGTDVIWIHLPSIANARAPRNFLRSMRNVPALLVRLRWNAKLFEALPQFPHILVNTIRAALLQFVAIETA
jgi:hypothetical protein